MDVLKELELRAEEACAEFYKHKKLKDDAYAVYEPVFAKSNELLTVWVDAQDALRDAREKLA